MRITIYEIGTEHGTREMWMIFRTETSTYTEHWTPNIIITAAIGNWIESKQKQNKTSDVLFYMRTHMIYFEDNIIIIFELSGHIWFLFGLRLNVYIFHIWFNKTRKKRRRKEFDHFS